ncbi:unnamed protein product [Auanema sp. JU1783]|nr:unnamed protein product [Auanema sp. JU1783]
MDDTYMAVKREHEQARNQILTLYAESMNAWNKINNAYVDMLSSPTTKNANEAMIIFSIVKQAADLLPDMNNGSQTLSVTPRPSFRGQRL